MINETLGIKNNYKFTRCNNEILAAILCEVSGISRTCYKTFVDDSGAILKAYEQTLTNILRNYSGKYIKELKIYECHNIVPSVVRDEIALLLSGTSITPTLKCNYFALGSNDTAPTNADTQLGAETLRGTFSNRYSVDNVCYLDKFFSSTEVAGDSFYEAGIFIDGAAGANTGYLLSRTLCDESIAIAESLSINISISIT